ncbi:hypothetical protein [Haladaptatus sp. NG-WS-4]
MESIEERVVNDIVHRDRHYRVEDFVKTIERHHHREKPGIPMELIDAYSDVLGYEREHTNTLIEDHLTDSTTWQPGISLYKINGNVSIYPLSWHEQLDDTDEIATFVQVMLESKLPSDGSAPNPNMWGIPQEEILTAIEIMTDFDRETGRELIQKQRLEGKIVIYAFQNPEDLVRLPEANR